MMEESPLSFLNTAVSGSERNGSDHHRSDVRPHTPSSVSRKSSSLSASELITPVQSRSPSEEPVRAFFNIPSSLSGFHTEFNMGGFVVSADDGTTASQDAGKKYALNPNAQEFRPQWGAPEAANGGHAFPDSCEARVSPPPPTTAAVTGVSVPLGVAPIFALNGGSGFGLHASTLPPPWTPSSLVGEGVAHLNGLAGAMKWPSARRSPPSTLTPRTAAIKGIHEDYAEVCRANGFHMVAVFNLEPRTTKEELLEIFFPMGAKGAEILPPRRSHQPNRRAGVVFFTSKAFVDVAVEKINNFVPNRQHQLLSVRYCGPDPIEVSIPVSSTASPLVLASTSTSTTGTTVTVNTRPSQQQSEPTVQLTPNSSNTTTPACATTKSIKPWRLPTGAILDRIHEEMWRFVCSAMPTQTRHVLAVHGLDRERAASVLLCNFIRKGAERYDMWPTKSCSFTPTELTCTSVSALVWYAEESTAREVVTWFQQMLPEDQTQPVDVVYLNTLACARTGLKQGNNNKNSSNNNNNNNNGSNVTSAAATIAATISTATTAQSNANGSSMDVMQKVDEFFLRKHDDSKIHRVSVHNLPSNTDKKVLFRLFFPDGALDADMYPNSVEMEGGVRRSGVLFFVSESSARQAAEKFNNATPFQESGPLIVRYLANRAAASSVTASAGTNASTLTANDTVTSADTDTPISSGVRGESAVSTVSTLTIGGSSMRLVRRTPMAIVTSLFNEEKPSPRLLAVVEELHKSTVDADELAAKMLALITQEDSAEKMASQLAAVIVDALTSMRHHAVSLSTPLVNALLALHEHFHIRRKGGKDADVFEPQDDSILTRNVFFMQTVARALIGLLMDNTKPHESRKVAAVVSGYLFQFSYLVKGPYELAVRVITSKEKALREAFAYKRNLQAMNNVNTSAFMDNDEELHKPWFTLIECLEQMTSLWRQANKSRAKKDPHRKEYEQRISEFTPSAAFSTGGPNSLNTSTRPTPRRVVSKVTPGSGGCSTGGSSSPGLTQASPIVPRVTLRNGVLSNDISLDSYASDVTISSRLDNVFSQRMTRQPLSSLFAPTNTSGTNTITTTTATAATVADSLRSVQPQQHVMPFLQQQIPTRTPGAVSQGVYTMTELMERTVYITKLPSTLRRAQFRRLLLHFGEFNKVRLCRDDNHHRAKGDMSHMANGDPSVTVPWFSFVEFAEPGSAKAMIEYFRNAVTNAHPFDFLLDSSSMWPVSASFTAPEVQCLLHTRTSPARNPIHDQLAPDAVLLASPHNPRLVVRHRPCLFALDGNDTVRETPQPPVHGNEAEDDMDLYQMMTAVMRSATAGVDGVTEAERKRRESDASANAFNASQVPWLKGESSVLPTADPWDAADAEKMFSPSFLKLFGGPLLEDDKDDDE